MSVTFVAYLLEQTRLFTTDVKPEEKHGFCK